MMGDKHFFHLFLANLLQISARILLLNSNPLSEKKKRTLGVIFANDLGSFKSDGSQYGEKRKIVSAYEEVFGTTFC